MIETAPTLGSIETSTRQKIQFAKQSLAYNVKDPTFCKLFPEYFKRHQEEVAARGGETEPLTSSESASGAMRRHDRIEMQGLLATAAGIFAILSIVLAMRFV
jgi:ubiquitin-conjugating enzyme E2 J2